MVYIYCGKRNPKNLQSYKVEDCSIFETNAAYFNGGALILFPHTAKTFKEFYNLDFDVDFLEEMPRLFTGCIVYYIYKVKENLYQFYKCTKM